MPLREGAGAGPLPPQLAEAERRTLLELAHASVRHGLEHGEPAVPDESRYPAALREPGASFVTLRRQGRLRGCTGTLEALRPRVLDVARNAFAAAFRDPRFPPLRTAELQDLEVHVSLLSSSEPVPVRSRAELLARLRPGVDGLTVEGYGRRATFLPAVWAEVPEPGRFLDELLRKAGLERERWSPVFRFSRYTAQSIDDPPGGGDRAPAGSTDSGGSVP